MNPREQNFSQVNDKPVNVVWINYDQLLIRELIDTLMYIVRVTCGGLQCVIQLNIMLGMVNSFSTEGTSN